MEQHIAAIMSVGATNSKAMTTTTNAAVDVGVELSTASPNATLTDVSNVVNATLTDVSDVNNVTLLTDVSNVNSITLTDVSDEAGLSTPCTARCVLSTFAVFASVLSIALANVERYVSIRRPLTPRNVIQ